MEFCQLDKKGSPQWLIQEQRPSFVYGRSRILHLTTPQSEVIIENWIFKNSGWSIHSAYYNWFKFSYPTNAFPSFSQSVASVEKIKQIRRLNEPEFNFEFSNYFWFCKYTFNCHLPKAIKPSSKFQTISFVSYFSSTLLLSQSRSQFLSPTDSFFFLVLKWRPLRVQILFPNLSSIQLSLEFRPKSDSWSIEKLVTNA